MPIPTSSNFPSQYDNYVMKTVSPNLSSDSGSLLSDIGDLDSNLNNEFNNQSDDSNITQEPSIFNMSSSSSSSGDDTSSFMNQDFTDTSSLDPANNTIDSLNNITGQNFSYDIFDNYLNNNPEGSSSFSGLNQDLFNAYNYYSNTTTSTPLTMNAYNGENIQRPTVVDVNRDIANNKNKHYLLTIGNKHYEYSPNNNSRSNNSGSNNSVGNNKDLLSAYRYIADKNYSLGEDQISAQRDIANQNFTLQNKYLDQQAKNFSSQLDFYNKQEQDQYNLTMRQLTDSENQFDKQYTLQQQQIANQTKLMNSQIDLANKNYEIANQQWQETLSEINHMKSVRRNITSNFLS